jgi:DNA-binding NarL/FixJ family response regulator
VIGHVLRTRPEGLYAATLLDVAAHLAALRGRWADAAGRLQEATTMVGDVHDPEFGQPLAFTAALLLEHDGDRAGAVVRLLDAAVPNPSASPYAWPVLWLAARFDADRVLAGEDPDARTEALVARMGDATPPQRAYGALAAVELARGRGTATGERWLAVAALWESCGWPYPRAYALHRAAEAASREGARAEAVAALREAAAIAGSLGATPLAAAVAALAARERMPLPDRNVPSAAAVERRLTGRELEVLKLVAAGRSNPQIAAELFISPKTASVHVSNILTKLEVATRVEAATLAQRSGLLAAG